ncbi:MAG TPA: FtsL-like putative cell division protein [Prolixibacteraceae bacterium]|nr:FtsL-like putative cell division protein [Prolixibacteraceae bacterium]
MADSSKKHTKLSFKQIILGNILVTEGVTKWFPVIGLITFMGLVMISSHFRGEKILRKMVVVQDSVRNLRSQSATIEAELMVRTQYSTVMKDVQKKGLGLVQSDEPPVKIYVKK